VSVGSLIDGQPCLIAVERLIEVKARLGGEDRLFRPSPHERRTLVFIQRAQAGRQPQLTAIGAVFGFHGVLYVHPLRAERTVEGGADTARLVVLSRCAKANGGNKTEQKNEFSHHVFDFSVANLIKKDLRTKLSGIKKGLR
jgi:hypothetical protein